MKISYEAMGADSLSTVNPTTSTPSIKAGLWRLVALIAVFTAVTGIFTLFDLDLSIQKIFYSPEKGWYLKHLQPWLFLYEYGTIPGLVLTLGALIGGVAGVILPRFRTCHRQMLLIFLTSLIGAGILVNGLLKPYWGRPRPRQVKEFSGQWAYRQPFQPGIPDKGQSFPCGHCTMGFLFCTLFFVKDRSRVLAAAGGGFGLVYGSLIGIGRIIQGAHFTTDVIWSLGVISLTATFLHYFVIPKLVTIPRMAKDLSFGQKVLWVGMVILLSAAVTFLFLTRRPYYETYTRPFEINAQVKRLIIESDFDFEATDVKFIDQNIGRLTVYAQGFGWLNASHHVGFKKRPGPHTLQITGRCRSSGYFSELTHRAELDLPKVLKGKIAIHFQRVK